MRSTSSIGKFFQQGCIVDTMSGLSDNSDELDKSGLLDKGSGHFTYFFFMAMYPPAKTAIAYTATRNHANALH